MADRFFEISATYELPKGCVQSSTTVKYGCLVVSAAERIRNELGVDSFKMTGSTVSVQSSAENWQKTLGTHSIWGAADVKYNSCDQTYTMQITISAEDVYNFNKGDSDIATGLLDEENGRFHVLGWAKQFRTYGELNRTVTWKDGNAPASTNVCNTANRDRSRDRQRGADRDRDRRDRGRGTGRYGS